MSWLGYEEIDWSRYRVEPAPIRLRLSQPLYFASSPPSPAPKPRPATPVERPKKPMNVATLIEPPKPGRIIPRRLELPAPRAAAQEAPIIIQPDFLPQATPPRLTLPPLAYWARKTESPKPPAAEIVPGRTEGPSPAPKFAAPPVLAVPNQQIAIADLNVSMPPVPLPQPPALVLPNSATTPVRLRDATETKAGSLESAAGQAANVMVLSTERREMRNVEIARGLQNIPDLAAADSVSTPVDHTPNTPASVGRGAAPAAESNQGKTSTNTASATPPAHSAAGESTNTAPAENVGEHPGIGLPSNAIVTRTITPPDVMRIEHPVNGNFDVVVMQSATRDDLPDLGGMLSGNPVYSVYLRVGDQKEWLLEYCVPGREMVQNNSYQINLDEAGSITPPYPISTVIPTGLLGQQAGKQIVVHGFLTSSGSFQGIKARDNNNPVLTQLLTLLNQWQFRPAQRNKKPIDVEIILVIPPRG
jgi:hypothetical protein